MLVKEEIRQAVARALATAQRSGALPELPSPEITVERPPSPEFGDYACSLPLKLARVAGLPAQTIARALKDGMQLPPSVAQVKVAGHGFINFFLADLWLQQQVDEILDLGTRYGSIELGASIPVQVEFVSANPTGPLHVGAGRNAALGDTLARLLAKVGFAVQREYLINDAGTQIERLTSSVFARYARHFGREVQLPEDGYQGEYVDELAEALVEQYGAELLQGEDALEKTRAVATDRVMAWVKQDLADLNVRYDNWFSERAMYARGIATQALELLRARGYVVEREGATWFTSTDLGQEKDEVLIRRSGQPTYFLTDIAYHYDKFVLRGFKRIINVWGADHQGQVPRLKAAMRALGLDPEDLTIIVYQLVSVIREGEPVRMGKRASSYITLREVLNEVGADAVRFFLVARSPEAMMDFDLDLAKKQALENPVYYVQYMHARIASILRNASPADPRQGDVTSLRHDSELALLRKMAQFPEVVEMAATGLAPHHFPYYAQDLARAFSVFYESCRVLPLKGDPWEPVNLARLKLVAACQQVLANTLELIGVAAPERM